MTKRYLLIIIMGLAAVLILGSCTRVASQVPVATQTPTSPGGLVALPTNGMGSIQMIGTQTAMAQAQLSGTATSTGPAALATSTPFGTPASPSSLTLVPPTGGAPTAIILTTQIPGVTPIIIVPSSTPGHPSTYTLMQGEFPWCIARRFNVNQNELMSMNGLSMSGQGLQAGMQLQIPQTGNPFVGDRALHSHPGTYTVSSTDDNIYKVACYFGDVDPTQIILANNLTSPYTLHFNQVLNIP